MKIKTVQTQGIWSETKTEGDEQSDTATLEIQRVMSSAGRAQNLTILTGLGTSLCVTKDGERAAPTMGDLIGYIEETLGELDAADDKFKEHDGRWSYFHKLAQVTSGNNDLEYLLSRAKVAADFLDPEFAHDASEILSIAETVIRDKVNFITDDIELPIHSAFLRRMARRSARRSRVKLFTTNYDLCFEVAARRSGFIVVDGFAFGSDAIFDASQFTYDVVRRSIGEEKSDFIENLFHLYKLHGSIDWELNEKTQQIAKKSSTPNPLLIYPRATKYEMAFSQPYIEMMGNFQASIRAPNTTLLVIGFGFNDKHIAEPILAAAKSNLSLNIVVVDPYAEEKTLAEGNVYMQAMSELIDHGDSRITLISAKFEGLVSLIPDVIAETELEKHVERIRKLGSTHV